MVVKFNGKGKDKYMSFNFEIVYTPDTELTKENLVMPHCWVKNPLEIFSMLK